jgi:hypothetical protein
MKTALFLILSVMADTSGATLLSVDLPHGGCRLALRPDGSGHLSYGALPRYVEFASGSFEFKAVEQALMRASRPQSQMPLRHAAGAVTLPGSAELRSLQDAEHASDLFRKAWGARAATLDARQAEDQESIGRACGFVEIQADR